MDNEWSHALAVQGGTVVTCPGTRGTASGRVAANQHVAQKVHVWGKHPGMGGSIELLRLAPSSEQI
jgi:hypothetical protein